MSGRTEAAQLLSPKVEYSLVGVRNTPRNPLANAWRFGKQLCQLKPDQLVTYNWGALEWAVGNRFGPNIPHIHIEDGFGPDEAAARFRRRVWLRRVGLAKVKTIIVPSRSLERIALEEWRFRRAGALPAQRRRYPALQHAGARGRARLREETGGAHHRHLRGAAPREESRPPDPRLRRRPAAECAAGDLRRRVRARRPGGHCPRQRHRRSLRLHRLPVPAGTGAGQFRRLRHVLDTEQMPYGLLEAMAAGMPVAATDVGDIKAMVAEENRQFIVNPADEAALTGALRNLLRDAALRAKLAAANQAKAKAEFSIDSMIETYDWFFGDTGPRRHVKKA